MSWVGEFECICIGNNRVVFDGVFDGMEIVLKSILNLGYGMCVGIFNEYGNGFWFFYIFYKSVFFFIKSVFVNKVSLIKDVWG